MQIYSSSKHSGPFPQGPSMTNMTNVHGSQAQTKYFLSLEDEKSTVQLFYEMITQE